ncbi:transmembrane 9 superfamily member 9-like isoform X1 [Amborella trichopoda]|uniref:transmembrane 9 superfamily member 9-like isoform X1 n=1 Tax=Amborella trichopoda TaxID=13333 RepID=UPI0009C17EB2|nr:transmembrane 9 superfamily member 9-like isoform X1 [Amborella trichopoda]XP_020529932.1 transmembrane 9 superfamily member 9-like isoform X1 [Amborella trichopoda]|eukprot:XP_020529931.1 transmembrane 9 superfamily member 9-like isoform X1 [Amborella trichopoda]
MHAWFSCWIHGQLFWGESNWAYFAFSMLLTCLIFNSFHSPPIQSNYEKYFINNHLHFKVIYHKDVKTNAEHIVGFEVIPYSVNHEYLLPWEEGKSLITCNSRTKQIDLASSIPQNLAEDKKVIFTYDDTFQEADATQALTLMSVLSLYRGASDTALIGT